MPAARAILWFASVAAIAMLARSLIIGPLPTWLTLVALMSYLSLLVAGVLVPQLEMYGDVFWRGDPATACVALTFDDGPDPNSTPRVLEILASRSIKATFFVVGAKARTHPELLKRMVEAGHEIGLHGFAHSYTHPWWSPKRVARDIAETQAVVQLASGVTSSTFRPPVGLVSPRTAAGARRAGVLLVAWSVRGRDGLAGALPQRIQRRVLAGLKPGAVVLLHDAPESPRAAEHPTLEHPTLQALPGILDAIRVRNLEPVTVRELAVRSGWLRQTAAGN